MKHILNSSWFLSMNDRHKRLVEVAVILYEREHALKEANDLETNLKDYSFIVFSMSKAYEGFLKRSFLDLKIIDKKTFESKRFRIGRALNPDIYENHKDKYWLYDDLEKLCGSELARELWQAWLECRNRVFHFYVKLDNSLSLESVEKKLLQLSNAMKSLVECQIDLARDQVCNLPPKKDKHVNKNH